MSHRPFTGIGKCPIIAKLKQTLIPRLIRINPTNALEAFAFANSVDLRRKPAGLSRAVSSIRNRMIGARFAWNDEAFRSEGQKWHIDGFLRLD